MTLSDGQFKLAVVAAALVLAAGLTTVRFCGEVSLPAKPAPSPETRTTEQAIEQVSASPTLYQDHLARDAATAGVRTPTYDEMTRKLAYRVDEGRHVLEVDDPPIGKAGLELALRRAGDAIVLEIRNTTGADLGYLVVTEPTPNVATCTDVRALPFNAVVIGAGQREVRVECAWRPGIAIAVKRIETAELSPLSAWYVAQVPPAHLAIESRIARGHRTPKTADRCISLVSQAVLAGLENGEIVWRDLVDFYARHRCQIYPFPAAYRAFTSDRERSIPAI